MLKQALARVQELWAKPWAKPPSDEGCAAARARMQRQKPCFDPAPPATRSFATASAKLLVAGGAGCAQARKWAQADAARAQAGTPPCVGALAEPRVPVLRDRPFIVLPGT